MRAGFDNLYKFRPELTSRMVV